ncbi:MAG: chromosome segregation protein SMC, partial [Myxococcota bacterium]
MRIKTLEIHGFKSFGDRVALQFGDGITGIVGPNGCGKSNIVDAVRWCMGEMSAKHLRGRDMQDVIFAGNETRGPMGMAEVTLTLHNDGNAPPQYAAYSEISVTRRLHRDGSSEYLVNKVPARLRDITDLFLGTGVGTRAYSIIEQGRIGFIVSSRPEDRRTLIEEVAGITRFKARKKAAERRMEATEQNLLRVNDIVSELDRQLVSLRRQAKKAARYKKLKAEQRDLELHAASIELLRLRAVEQVQRTERRRLEEKVELANATVATEEAGLEGDRLDLADEERRLQDVQQESAEIDNTLTALERDLEHWRRQLDEATQRAQHMAADVQNAKERKAVVRTERRDLEQHARELEQAMHGEEERFERLGADVSRLQSAIADTDQAIEDLRRDAIEHVHGAAQHRTLAQNLDRQRTDVHARLGRAIGERDDLKRRKNDADERAASIEVRRADVEHQLELWHERLGGYREQLERVTADEHRSDARVLGLKNEITERRSRLESLQEIARRFEGYSDGVRTLLGAEEDTDGDAVAATSKPPDLGIQALVTDVIEAAPEYERAIESALGEKLQYLIVESQKVGMHAVEFLKQRAGGRSGFIPLKPRARAASGRPDQRPGVVGGALDCVTVKPDYQAVAEYLLGDVVVVDELSTALDVWARNGHTSTFGMMVTMDGDLLDPAGVLAGGSNEGTGLLGKRREMRELEDVLHALESRLSLAQGEHEQLVQARLQLEVNIQQLEKDVQTSQIDRVELGKDFEAATAEGRQLGERIEVLDYEVEQHREELVGIDREEGCAKAAAAASESEQKDLEERIEERQASRRRHASVLDERNSELTNLKVAAAARDQKLQASRAATEKLALTEAELKQRVERGVGSINEDTSLVSELKGKIAEADEAARNAAASAQVRRDALSKARGEYEAKRAGMSELERGLRERRKELEFAKEAQVQVNLDLQRLEMDRQRLLEQIAERHDIDLQKVVGDYHMRGMPGPEAGERQEQLDRALKTIGPINLTAIEECDEIETRHGFLAHQRDDLQAALESLRRAIQRINRTSREQFKQAFESVNDMFQKVF